MLKMFCEKPKYFLKEKGRNNIISFDICAKYEIRSEWQKRLNTEGLKTLYDTVFG